MNAITIINPDEFKYEDFTEPERNWLQEKAAYIHARLGVTHHLIAEMGNAFLEVKAKLEPSGRFLAWTRTEFGVSDDTIEQYMNVAKNIPFLPEGAAGLITAKALYTLAGPNADPLGVAEALEKLEAGQPVDYAESYILARAPAAYIRERYLATELPKQQAHQLVKRLISRGTPDEVRAYCIEQQVTHASVVDYLATAYQDEEKQKGWKKGRTTYSTIVEDGGVLNGLGWSVPLKDANARDLDRFTVDRAVMHKDEAATRFDWKVARALITQVEQKGGESRVVLVLDNSRDVEAFVGSSVVVHLRVPAKE